MCKSVPQMEAVLTRTNTSVGPMAGTLAVSNDNPRAGCILRKAFIIVGISEFAGGILAGAGLMLAHREGLVGAVTFSYFSLALSFESSADTRLCGGRSAWSL